MAIIKNTELSSGITISYIRIKSIQKSFDVDRGAETIISVEYYLNSDARLNKSSVKSEMFVIPVVNSFADAYLELKAIPKFFGATDSL